MNNAIIAVVAWFIAEGSGLMQKFIHSLVMAGYLKTNRIKPLDCPMCLAFWMSLVYNFIETYNPMTAILSAILSSSLAILISKVYIRL